MAAHVCADEVHVYAAAGVKAPLSELAAQFEKTSGHRLALVFDTAGATLQRFLKDPRATVLITGDARIRDAERTGMLREGFTHKFAATVGGFAVPPGKTKPDIGTAEKLKAALIAAPRIVFSDPERGATIGLHFMKVIEKLGVKEQVLKKAALAKNGVETMRIILAGEADLGVTQIAEVVQADREALAGPFPGEYDLATTYSLWYRPDGSPTVRAFAQMITGSSGREKLRYYGLRSPSE
ncbi:MAG: molybdate ABC transporter substrate-binding protein [Syntrophales bacterium]